MASPRKTALLLVHRIPWPPDKGDKIRSWQLFRFLAERYDLACGFFVDDPADLVHVDHLRALCREVKAVPLNPAVARLRSAAGLLKGRALSFDYYTDPEMTRWVRAQLHDGIDVAFAFSSAMMPYLEAATVPVFADLVDADSAKWTQYAGGRSWPMSWVYAREGRLLADAEAAMTRTATHTFLITPEEAAIVAAHPDADTDRLGWYRNGVDTTFFDPAGAFGPVAPAPDLIFTGAMDYDANIDAVSWFAAHCWPQLRERHPDLTFAIVGARPAPPVQRLGDLPGITVTGRVGDMRPWLAAARIAIAPLRIARGVQNKVLEAMAMARPVVASPGAAVGIEAEPGRDLLVADGEAAFCDTVERLLAAPELARRLGEAARAQVMATASWSAQLDRLGTRLKQAGL